MQNKALAMDYIKRASARLKAIATLFEEESWADVVRQSQEVLELALTAFLRSHGVEPPRIHDVSAILLAERSRLPHGAACDVDALAAISKDMRRDRELSFYGSDDLTPSEFYSRTDAEKAKRDAERVVKDVRPFIRGGLTN